MSAKLSLLDFVRHLSQRQKTLLARAKQTPYAAQLAAVTPSLSLAQAALEKQELSAKLDLPLQIAVLGPTQAGKSSLVNLILGQPAAGVSPLAGFTIHPQAFLNGLQEVEVSWLKTFFPGFQCLDIQDLPRDRYACIGLAKVQARPNFPPCILWDTPDFDSLRARDYLEGLLRVAALADCLVFVVSKDKYADQAVWDFLVLLEELKQPALVCLNKLRPGTQEILLKSWEEKWRKLRKDPCPPLVTLEYCQRPENFYSLESILLKPLCSVLSKAPKRRSLQAKAAKALVRRYFDEWTAPIRAELQAEQQFKTMVEQALEQALAVYRKDFLDHPQDAMLQRTLEELLTLLEIPGIARPMTVLRKACLWPVKALFKRRRPKPTETQETLILRRSIEHTLLHLLASIREQICCQPNTAYWWQALERRYQAAYPRLIRSFEAQMQAYYQAFAPQVEKAAQKLYLRLKEMPVTLNGLRAARASADAAGLALIFHTGGIGPHDFVLAPTMLSLTSFLAESALGKVLESVAADLKRTQLQAIKALLTQLGEEIAKLATHMDEGVCFGIPQDALTQIEAQLIEPSYLWT